ncbi:dephospho-CoA kinase [Hujiaoplasma nucleasis]|uniref:Dephospho-CoA kinase n=1 Tax=Hujiaoplasma nucleasis TaxID=2725268 RepID=A0A7L6MZD8_9MOLU|nr:dephospho-CoA kinase [Hujiaoplasma nucleasis]QLY39356.1 dephospho-CoA kinase [Hujiaoplasma nucleasis]
MKVIGVTGGVASGKTLISDWFEKVHIKVIDADKVYKRLTHTNKEMYQEIIDTFALTEKSNQELDFKSLAKIVFNDKEKLKILNSLTHPYVIKEIEAMIETYRVEDYPLVVLDVPLLFEAGMEKYCDEIICVYADRESQIERLMKRGHLDRKTAIQRIDSQMSLDEKKEKSDYVIDNSWSRDHTYHQFIQILSKLKS